MFSCKFTFTNVRFTKRITKDRHLRIHLPRKFAKKFANYRNKFRYARVSTIVEIGPIVARSADPPGVKGESR